MSERRIDTTPDYLIPKEPSGEWGEVDMEAFERLEPLSRLFDGDVADCVRTTIEITAQERDPNIPHPKARQAITFMKSTEYDGYRFVHSYFAIMFPSTALTVGGPREAILRDAATLGFAPKDTSDNSLARCSYEAKERAKAVLEVKTDTDLLGKYSNLLDELTTLIDQSWAHNAASLGVERGNTLEALMQLSYKQYLSLAFKSKQMVAPEERLVTAARKQYATLRREERQKQKDQETVDHTRLQNEQIAALRVAMEQCHNIQKKWRWSSKELKKKGFQETIRTAVVGLEDIHGETVLSGRGKEEARTLVSSLAFLEGLAYRSDTIEEAQEKLVETLFQQQEVFEKIDECSAGLNGNMPARLAKQGQDIRHSLGATIDEIRENWPKVRSLVEKTWPKDSGKAAVAIESVLFIPE